MTFRITLNEDADHEVRLKLIHYLGRRRARLRDGLVDGVRYFAEVNGKQWGSFNAWLNKHSLRDGPFTVERVPE